jgi:hypothetical protein
MMGTREKGSFIGPLILGMEKGNCVTPPSVNVEYEGHSQSPVYNRNQKFDILRFFLVNKGQYFWKLHVCETDKCSGQSVSDLM